MSFYGFAKMALFNSICHTVAVTSDLIKFLAISSSDYSVISLALNNISFQLDYWTFS